MLKLETGLANTTSRKLNSVSDEGLSSVKLPKSSDILVGGVPAGMKIPNLVSTTNFQGAMDKVKINGEAVGLWNWKVLQVKFSFLWCIKIL